MLEQTRKYFNKERLRRAIDIRNIGLYIFALIVLAITWSGVKTVQTNYQLEKQISELKQQNTVLQLQNGNTDLQNKYYQTDEYLDLTARQNLGLAAPGEKVLLVPKNVAMKYVDAGLASSSNSLPTGQVADTRSKYAKNLEDWRDFLLGRKLFSD